MCGRTHRNRHHNDRDKMVGSLHAALAAAADLVDSTSMSGDLSNTPIQTIWGLVKKADQVIRLDRVVAVLPFGGEKCPSWLCCVLLLNDLRWTRFLFGLPKVDQTYARVPLTACLDRAPNASYDCSFSFEHLRRYWNFPVDFACFFSYFAFCVSGVRPEDKLVQALPCRDGVDDESNTTML